MYNREYNIDFYNIPKCGMTSIVNSIKFEWVDVETIPKDRKIFTVIRNPISRCISSYLHIKRNQGFSHRKPVNKNIFKGDLLTSFNDYLIELETYGFLDSHDLPQIHFINGVTSKMITIPRKIYDVNVFILFENIQQGLNELTNSEIKLKKLNSSNNGEKNILNQSISKFEDRIKKIYSEDLELYNKLKGDINIS